MNKFIKEQLDKTKINIPPYNENTEEIFIPQSGLNKISSDSIEIGKLYLAFIENYIINEPENFTLSANWNHGTKPPENRVYLCVIEESGKMLKVSVRGVTTNIQWSGWLPKKSVSIISES